MNYIKDTQDKIAVMQAFLDGQEIDVKHRRCNEWIPCDDPCWYWCECDYRIRPESELVQEIRKIIELCEYEIDRTKLKDYRIYLTGMLQELRRELRIIEANGE